MSLNRWSLTTFGKKMYSTILFVFTMVASTSCSSGGGNPPNPQTVSDRVIAFHTPLHLFMGDLNEDGLDDNGCILLNQSTTPSWVEQPVDARNKIALLFSFSHPIDPSTLKLGHTFELTLNGEVAEGTWQTNPDFGSFFPANYDAVFYANRPTSEIIPVPLGAGDSLFVSLRMKGTSGPITDVNGNILPFNGVYRVPEAESGALIVTPFKTEDLFDGDMDGVPGGDFVKDFEITG